MSDNLPSGPTISFTCPVCGDDVEMVETDQHHLKQLSERHLPKPPYKAEPGEEQCKVHFDREERIIRQQYDFIRYEVPTVFMGIPSHVRADNVLEAGIQAVEDQNIGLTVQVDVEDGPKGKVMAWYHGNQPAYYAVTDRLRTPQNVLVSGNRDELQEFISNWFYRGTDKLPKHLRDEEDADLTEWTE